MSTTINLADFGYRELDEAALILKAIKDHGYPDDFSTEGVHLMFNRNSGYVFLTNNDYQAAMVDDDGDLYILYCLRGSGEEGSFLDLLHAYETGVLTNEEDIEELKEIAERLEIEFPEIKE